MFTKKCTKEWLRTQKQNLGVTRATVGAVVDVLLSIIFTTLNVNWRLNTMISFAFINVMAISCYTYIAIINYYNTIKIISMTENPRERLSDESPQPSFGFTFISLVTFSTVLHVMNVFVIAVVERVPKQIILWKSVFGNILICVLVSAVLAAVIDCFELFCPKKIYMDQYEWISAIETVILRKVKPINGLGLIVARNTKNFIGVNNTLMYNLPDDLKHFKKVTSSRNDGKNFVIVGRKTFESLPRVLENRVVVVVSESLTVDEIEAIYSEKKGGAGNVCKADSVSNAIATCLFMSNPDEGDFDSISNNIWIIGGKMIYDEAMPYVSKIELTTIMDESISGDTTLEIPEKFYTHNAQVVLCGENNGICFDTRSLELSGL